MKWIMGKKKIHIVAAGEENREINSHVFTFWFEI